MGTDWLRQLRDRLDSGEWLTHTPEGEPEGVLIAVFVEQARRVSLVYQQPGDDQYFQLFLNPDGTKADAMWSSAETGEPEVYTEEEMEAVEGQDVYKRQEFLRQGMAPVRQVTIGPMFVGRKLEEIGWESVPMNDPRITAHPDWLENLQKWAGQNSQSFEIHETCLFYTSGVSLRFDSCH